MSIHVLRTSDECSHDNDKHELSHLHWSSVLKQLVLKWFAHYPGLCSLEKLSCIDYDIFHSAHIHKPTYL